jgi:hypothetical protein
MEKLRIVFMGTPEFAVGILDTIIKNNLEVVGVITAADKPAGRGQKIKYSAVKEYALVNNLKLLQPTNLKNETLSEPALKKIGARKPGRKRPIKRPAVPCFAKSSSTLACLAGGKIRRNQFVPSSRVPNFWPAKKIMLSPHNTPAYMNALT